MSAGSGGVLDFIARLLADKSEQTRRAYRADLTDFFRARYEAEPTPELVQKFLALPQSRLEFTLTVYREDLRSRGLADATVTRRLAALKSLLDFARREGVAVAHAPMVKLPRVRTYRDTAGLSAEQVRALLAQPDRSTVRGRRDYAILLLLVECALRSGEIRHLTVASFSYMQRTLVLPSASREQNRQAIEVNAHTADAIRGFLAASGHGDQPEAALFHSLHPAGGRGPLTGWGLHKIIRECAERAGIEGRISPRRLRHTAITSALEASGGNVALVQQLSRHARAGAVARYNENREQQSTGAADQPGDLTSKDFVGF